MALSHQWKSDEALARGGSSLASTAIALNSITGPAFSHCTLDSVVFDFRLQITVSNLNPPPERWITATNPMVTIQHDPGSTGSAATPFSDDPRLMGVLMLRQQLRLSPSLPSEYVVIFSTWQTYHTNKQRVGSGSAFNPPHVTAWLWSLDGYNDLTGAIAYSINIDWFGMLRANFAHN